tara:strand:+ start:1109 stop:1315 length:207 start_codon:yes stop_codon:yes gene_type:complete
MEEETFGDYYNGVRNRMAALSEDEMKVLGRLQGSPQGEILGRVLGENLGLLSGQVTPPKPKRGLAARK